MVQMSKGVHDHVKKTKEVFTLKFNYYIT